MKSLYLVRHAKSDWGDENLADIDRPLNSRGYMNAHTMSNFMNAHNQIPELIITSPAIRAISTALIFCRNFKLDASKIIIQPELYNTSVKHYTEVIKQCDNGNKRVMLLGHNPIISDLASSLIPSFKTDLPTCGILGIRWSADVDWKKIKEKEAAFNYYDFPKNHPF